MRRATAIAAAAVLCLALAGVARALCAPATRAVFPASGIVGTTVAATITGTGLSGADVEVFGEAGITATVQSTSEVSVALQLAIEADAAPGERILELVTPGGSAFVGFTVNPAGGPVVTAVSPPPIVTRGFGIDLRIDGQNLSGVGADAIAISGEGVTVAEAIPDPAGTFVELSLDVAPDADLGTHALMLDTPLGGAVLQVYVQRPAPTISGVSPSAVEIGATVPLTITGENLTGAALVITSGEGSAAGVAITDVSTPDDGTLLATLHVDPGLSPETEPRLLIVTTETGQRTAELFVLPAGVPSLTGASPGAGEPGTAVDVVLRGLNLTGATLSTTSSDIALQSPVVLDDETAAVRVLVDGGATPGTDHTIRATVGGQTADIAFRVIAAGAPFVGAVRPPFGNRGDVVTLLLDGVNLGNVVEGTGVQLSGPKITESNAEALDDRTVRAILELDATASIGYRDVTVTTSSGSFTRDAAFRVNIPGQIPVIADVSPRALEPGTTTTMTVTGSGFLGAGVTVGGPGAVVGDTLVSVDGTQITFELTLAEDAPAESRAVIVVTENGTATCHVRSLPPEIALAAPDLLKTGSVLEVTGGGYRLFLFELSMSDLFEPGLRTVAFASPDPILVVSRAQAHAVGRAVRDLPFGYVRVRAVTATSQVGTSAAYRVRR